MRVSEILWPRCCHICGKQLAAHEKFLCDACMAGLPKVPTSYDGMKDRLGWLPNLVSAHSWLHYGRHLTTAKLLTDIKYHGHSKLMYYLGKKMVEAMSLSGIFHQVDAIVCVPLHFRRRLKRGYNQSEVLARALSKQTSIPFVNALKAHSHRTQTRMSGQARAANVEGVYYINPGTPLLTEPAKYKHILLIDDVCTTGATLRNCCATLNDALLPYNPHLKISVLTLCMAR